MNDFIREMFIAYGLVIVFILIIQYFVELVYFIVHKICQYRKEHF